MKIAALTTCNSRSAGGLYYTIPSFCKELKAHGCDVSVISYNDRFSSEDTCIYGEVPMLSYDVSKAPLLRQLGYSKDLYGVLDRCKPDIVHQQGIWMYHSVVAKKYRKANQNSRLIIEPHGMLDPWAVRNSHWKKKIAGWCFENDNLRNADCIHALCHSEYRSIREYGLRNPVAIIPNGIYLPVAGSVKRLERKRKTLLVICRLHPKKGLLELIQALGLLKSRRSDFVAHWNLRIAGWDQGGFANKLNSLVHDLDLNDCVEFIGSIYGEKKVCELASADAFILPSYSEGLPMSVLEAWSYGLPVVMTDACNLPEGFEAKAALKVTTAPENIADVLESLDAMNVNDRLCMGRKGLELVSNKFSWATVACNTECLYKWLVGEGEKPEFVYTE